MRNPKKQIKINGMPVAIASESDMPLLWFLREVVWLTGTKFGCGIAQCGACTVLVRGNPVRSCVTPIAAALGTHICRCGTYLRIRRAIASARAV
jgi:isoquinoline 1-oxidoreductase subunit alpha